GGLRAGVEPFVEQLAAPTATPGGGSASAAAAAMAAGLAHMVAAMSRGKKAYAQYERELSEAIAQLATLKEDLKAAIDEDAKAYDEVVKAFKASKDVSDPNALTLPAIKQATLVPLGVAEKAREVKGWAETLGPITNPKMASDLTVSKALADAAVTGAVANVEINLQDLPDQAFVGQIRGKLAALKN
ncbi:MAG: cyclodeaminase/cyclohydrolase family protein, partial [Bryobacteraceae bacterium]